jgi:hypothetical protein
VAEGICENFTGADRQRESKKEVSSSVSMDTKVLREL